MNFVFAIYANDNYCELHLPALDNADYTMVLRASELGLMGDVQVQLDVMNQRWRIKPSTDYQLFCKGRMFEGEQLEHGQILQLITKEKEKLVLLVWRSTKELTPFRKYRVGRTDRITIGKSEENDICCTSQKILSHRHGEICFTPQGVFIRDLSTNGLYLGSVRVNGQQPLRFGDLVNMYGLSILFLGEYLAIRCLDGDVQVNQRFLQPLEEVELEERTQFMHPTAEPELMVHISPRTMPILHEDAMAIENIPPKQETNERPVWMSVLPSLTMVIPMTVGYALMGRGNMGVGIIISAGSALVGVFWAIMNLRYAKKEQREREMLRLSRYEEYLVRCADQIQEKYDHNKRALRELYPDAKTCSGYGIQDKEIWARKAEHSDFLFLRMGTGDMPFQMKLTAPGTEFSMIEDELAKRPMRIVKSFQTMHRMPLGVNLMEHSVVGVLCDGSAKMRTELLHLMVTQIAANHSYTDVKIGALYNGVAEQAGQWALLRWLPHVWNEERSIRYIAASQSEIGEVLYALAESLRTRAEQQSGLSSRKDPSLPHYVLFVEAPELLEGQMICKYLYEAGQALGITTVIFAQRYEDLPSACSFVVERTQQFSGLYSVGESDNIRQELVFDAISPRRVERMARRMTPMRVNEMEHSGDIPNALTFFEMMKIHQLPELNVLERWQKNRTYESMRALVGQKAGGANCYLNIHEKYHGPHGLVAGTTGAGKSETLQTYILALAANFSPMDVGFFIIDFKGGGMANLFERLPHMMGQISNLSGNLIHRAMVSIKSENKRRQKLFSDFNVNHIDAYTKLVKKKEATIPIPHLLIVIDEFAELKREEPDFMRELISVAQVGRSLGVHLILATQKPGGTVDDNIRSNTKFKLCLRVASQQDSKEMLGKPDAAYLTQAGRCYLQVGNDEIYELFQSGWSGAVYDPKGSQVDKTVVMLDLQGREALVGSRAKSERKEAALHAWVEEIVRSMRTASRNLSISVELAQNSSAEREKLIQECIRLLNTQEEQYQANTFNIQCMEDVVRLWPEGELEEQEAAQMLLERFQKQKRKLPEKKEKTQLEATVEYLAQMAQKYGFENDQKLWMPVLPEKLYLEELPGYAETTYQDGHWPQHGGDFQLSAYLGLVDAPENQMQFPLTIDLARNGHLVVAGGVTSGKSVFVQSMFYSLISTYTPDEVNLYAIDFSSQMLCPFERDAHVGGVVLEGENDRLNKLFGMMIQMLRERKQIIKGGSFQQYIQVHGHVLPAMVLAIDGYANFREKTENRFENELIELSRDAEGYGIYLVITCNAFGGAELQSKIADKMRQSICLELGDKYNYVDILHTSHLEVLPEANVKGRGLVEVSGSILEYQTALACRAENDYERSAKIEELCQQMSEHWQGKRARLIPEIPAKPTWELLAQSEEYQRQLERGGRLPVAYYQEDASLYCVDLSHTFCYLVQGKTRSGKSVLMRNLACAARDTGGKIYVVDREDQSEQSLAKLVDGTYCAAAEELFQLTKELILLTNQRGGKRKELMAQGLEEEEIFQAMQSYPPVYVFVADLNDYLQRIYSGQGVLKSVVSAMENILSKGQLLNVYFLAAVDSKDVVMLQGRAAYQSFVRQLNGVALGGELSKQSTFTAGNLPYAEQNRPLKTGFGYAVRQDELQVMDLIVIPQNKGVIPS